MYHINLVSISMFNLLNSCDFIKFGLSFHHGKFKRVPGTCLNIFLIYIFKVFKFMLSLLIMFIKNACFVQIFV